MNAEAPLILTVGFDDATFAALDALRRRHFPAGRNVVPAHCTLFHALPGSERIPIVAELDRLCRQTRAFAMEATGLRSLGRGVAIAFSSPELVRIRQALAREWQDWLTPQDSARIAPHVTIQNKVSPEIARATLRDLEASFTPFAARAEGLVLWHYRGGPWEPLRRFRFAG